MNILISIKGRVHRELIDEQLQLIYKLEMNGASKPALKYTESAAPQMTKDVKWADKIYVIKVNNIAQTNAVERMQIKKGRGRTTKMITTIIVAHGTGRLGNKQIMPIVHYIKEDVRL